MEMTAFELALKKIMCDRRGRDNIWGTAFVVEAKN